MEDPKHHQLPGPTWFSDQFQYHNHSPLPPPPNHNQQQAFLSDFRPSEMEYDPSMVISTSYSSIQQPHFQNASSMFTYLPPTFASMDTPSIPVSYYTCLAPNYLVPPENQPHTAPYIVNSSHHQVVPTSVLETTYENHVVSSSPSFQQLISASQFAQNQTTTKPTIHESAHVKIPIKSTNVSCEVKVFNELPQSSTADSKVQITGYTKDEEDATKIEALTYTSANQHFEKESDGDGSSAEQLYAKEFSKLMVVKGGLKEKEDGEVITAEKVTTSHETILDISGGHRAFIDADEVEEPLKPLKESGSKYTNICFSNKSFSLDAAHTAEAFLSSLKELTEVDLSDFIAGRLGTEALKVMKIFSSVVEGCELRSLNLSNNARAFGSLFKSQRTLEELHLMNDCISEEVARAMCELIPSTKKLRVLQFHNNMMGDEGVIVISELVKHSHVLEDFWCSSARVDFEWGVALAKALGTCSHLKKLDLGDNMFGIEAGMAISKALPGFANRIEVYLSYRNLEDEGSIALVNAPTGGIIKHKWKCRDLVFLDFFIAFWVAIIVNFSFGFNQGNPLRLNFGLDYQVNVSGDRHADPDLRELKLRYWLNPNQVYQSGLKNSQFKLGNDRSVCLMKCPNPSEDSLNGLCDYPEGDVHLSTNDWIDRNYDYFADLTPKLRNTSLQLQGFCYPIIFPSVNVYWSCQFIALESNVSLRHWQQIGGVSIVEDILVDKSIHRSSNSQSTVLKRYAADVRKAWPVLIVCGGIIPAIWLLLIRHFVVGMPWITVILFNVLIISVTMFYYWKDGWIGNSTISPIIGEHDSYYTVASRELNHIRPTVVLMTVTRIVAYLSSIAIILRTLMATSVIKVAGQVIGEVRALRIFPLIPYTILVVFYMISVSTALHLFSYATILFHLFGYYWATKFFIACYKALNDHKVMLEGTLLKPNIVTPGSDSKKVAPEMIAEYTVYALQRTMPSAAPVVVFFSGEQSEEETTVNLNAMNKLQTKKPWSLSFSFGRAFQQSSLKAWSGKEENVKKALKAYVHTNISNVGIYGAIVLRKLLKKDELDIGYFTTPLVFDLGGFWKLPDFGSHKKHLCVISR